jgi:glycosyltransferase involved in cell wall biosynthesis
MNKILVLWSHHSGYLHGCLQELARHSIVKAVFFEPSLIAPFSKHYFEDARYDILWVDPLDQPRLISILSLLLDFNPDQCLVNGWHHQFYVNQALRSIDSYCVKVLCFDWQWRPSLRNYLKAIYGRLWKSRLFDVCFVSGERQYQFALRAGFPSSAIFQGLYASGFEIHVKHQWTDRSNSIAFVGRLVPSKGCHYLAAAWNTLQSKSIIPDTWNLDIYGVGPLDTLFKDLPRCNVHGFLQPNLIEEILCRAKILCVPSVEEPWGLQIHEATRAGLAVIATDVCGSAVHLVRSGFNGEIVPSADAEALVNAIQSLVSLDSSNSYELQEYGRRSLMLSEQFTPVIWSNTVHKIFSSVKSRSRPS